MNSDRFLAEKIRDDVKANLPPTAEDIVNEVNVEAKIRRNQKV